MPDGQMLHDERVALHEAVLRRRPRTVFEVGTWCGGGSTYQIVSALQKIGSGHLTTCEIDQKLFAEAHAFYSSPELSRFCTVHNRYAHELLLETIEAAGPPDLAFFDGSEDPHDALYDFQLLDRHAKSGTVLLVHDWLPHRSAKANLLRPYLEKLETWKILRVLMPPISVGLVEAVKL